MQIIYYSHARNTHRFITRHLIDALNEKGHAPWVTRLHARGPRHGISHISDEAGEHSVDQLWIPDGAQVIFVTPTYGKYNHERHRAENFTPEPIRQAIRFAFDNHHPWETGNKFYIAVGGNRTFGKDYAKQDAEYTDRIEWLGDFELSGSETEAKKIVDSL